MKRQVTDWQQVFIKHVSDKGNLSRVYEKLLQIQYYEA